MITSYHMPCAVMRTNGMRTHSIVASAIVCYAAGPDAVASFCEATDVRSVPLCQPYQATHRRRGRRNRDAAHSYALSLRFHRHTARTRSRVTRSPVPVALRRLGRHRWKDRG